MRSHILKLFLSGIIVCLTLYAGRPALAASPPSSTTLTPQYCIKDGVCQPTLANGQCEKGWGAPQPKCPCPNGKPGDECIPLKNPLKGNITDIFIILGTIIRVALSIIGSLTLLMFVWGGFLLLTSAGSAERVEKGTKTMLFAAIGAVCVFASYFVLSNFIAYLTTGAGST